MAWPLHNVAENNTRFRLCCPPNKFTKRKTNFNEIKTHSQKRKKRIENTRATQPNKKFLPNFLSWKLGFGRVPNTEIGGAIVDYDGSVAGEETVIRLTLNLRNERHFCCRSTKTLRDRVKFFELRTLLLADAVCARYFRDPRTSIGSGEGETGRFEVKHEQRQGTASVTPLPPFFSTLWYSIFGKYILHSSVLFGVGKIQKVEVKWLLDK